MAMMISKFHKIIQSKVVWTVFAVLISVAFVSVYTGARNSGGGNDARNEELAKPVGRLWGEDISRQEFGAAYRDVFTLMDLQSLFQYNSGLPNSPAVHAELNRQAWLRLATLKKAEQMGLSVTPDQLQQVIKEFQYFRSPQTGLYDKQMESQFLGLVQQRYGLPPQEFANLLSRNALLQKATSIVSQGALVSDDEIKQTFHLYNDKITVEHATLPRSLAEEVEITEEIAKEYYLRNLGEFIKPESRVVKSVQFQAADYTNSVSVTDELIAQSYENNKQLYVIPETATNTVPEYKPLEEVKGDIAAELTKMLAHRAAFNDADKLVAALATPGTTFEGEAEKAGLAIKQIPPFSATGRVIGTDASAPVARAAFGLSQTPTDYYSDPVVGRETIYVLSLKEIRKPEQLTFEFAKDDATEAARVEENDKAYIDRVAAIHEEVETALKGGTSFTNAIAKYNLEMQTTEPFSISEPLEGDYSQQLMAATLQFEAGTLSELVDADDEYMLAYIATKTPADEAAELPAQREQISRGLRSEKARAQVQAWQAGLLDEAEFEDLTLEASTDES